MNFADVSLVVLFTGVLVVFLVLLLLIAVIKILSAILNRFLRFRRISNDIKIFSDKQITKEEKIAKDTKKNSNEDEKIIAAISAAVAYKYLSTGKKYKIHSIKRNFYADNRSSI